MEFVLQYFRKKVGWVIHEKIESIMSLMVEATYWAPGEYYYSLRKLNENVEGAIKVRNIVFESL